MPGRRGRAGAVGPEEGDLSLIRSTRGAVFIANLLDLIEGRGEFAAGHGWRRGGPEAVGFFDREWFHIRPIREQRGREKRRRGLPGGWRGARRIRLDHIRAVVFAGTQNTGGGFLTEEHPGFLDRIVGNFGQRRTEGGIES